MPKKYAANPFRSGTVFQEGSQYGYYGKDIYGKFHQSPVLYPSRAKAKEALDRQIFNRGAYRMNPNRKKKATRPRRTYRRNPARTVANPHGARALALCYDNESAQQSQKESIINNLAKKMAKGVYNKAMAVKLWSYAAKSGADAYAKQYGSHGDTGSSMFNAATRLAAAKILEEENEEYVKERAESFGYKKNPSRRARKSPRRHRRNPAPSKEARVAKLTRMRSAAYDRYQATDDNRHEHAYSRLTSMRSRAEKGDKSWFKGMSGYRHGAKPTASRIKAIAQANGSRYFDKASMKFFGNTMSDFKVFRSSRSGRIFIGAPSRVKKGYYSLHEFTGKRLNSTHGSPERWADVKEWVNRQ